MLKGIPDIISPELLKVLMEMGQGDEIAFVDSNFPAASHAQKLIRCDGHTIIEILEAVLPLFPLDTSVPAIYLISVAPEDNVVPIIGDEYDNIIKQYADPTVQKTYIERNIFYERTKQAYAIVATGEHALYANIILKKGRI